MSAFGILGSSQRDRCRQSRRRTLPATTSTVASWLWRRNRSAGPRCPGTAEALIIEHGKDLVNIRKLGRGRRRRRRRRRRQRRRRRRRHRGRRRKNRAARNRRASSPTATTARGSSTVFRAAPTSSTAPPAPYSTRRKCTATTPTASSVEVMDLIKSSLYRFFFVIQHVSRVLFLFDSFRDLNHIDLHRFSIRWLKSS